MSCRSRRQGSTLTCLHLLFPQEIELSDDKLRDIRRNLLTPAAFSELERQATRVEGAPTERRS